MQVEIDIRGRLSDRREGPEWDQARQNEIHRREKFVGLVGVVSIAIVWIYVHYANRYEGDYLIKARPSPHSNHRRREKNGKDDTNHEIMRWSWDGKSQYVYASDGDLNIICLLPPLFSESIAAAVQWVYCRQVSMDHHICFWKRYGNQ